MTREEAIKILKAIRVFECYPKSASEETKEAIDTAIEALSAEVVHKPDYSYEADMVRRLKEALSAEVRPTEEWIPVSERLPDKTGWYVVTVAGLETIGCRMDAITRTIQRR